jgi:hypothetical protein
MSEGSKERSPQQLAKSRRDYLAQVKMLTVDELTREAAKINKALGIKAPKGTDAAATLDAARAAYIRLLGSLGRNAEVKAEVTRFVTSSIKCNYGRWTLSPARVRQHFPRRLTPVRATSLGSEW